MRRFTLGLCFLVLPIFSGNVKEQRPANDLRISWDFENGSLGSWRINERSEVVLAHASNSGELWYFFRINGVLNKTVTFVFENVRKDFYGGDNRPSLSYDQIHWSLIPTRWTTPVPDNPERVRFLFTHTFAQNQAWIAYTPPFSNRSLDQLLMQIENHPHVKIRSLCETPLRRLRLPLIQITDPQIPLTEKKTILLLSREDAYETASSWISQGAVQFLLTEEPVAAAIKKRYSFLILPIFDPDGVALGCALHPLPNEKENVFWTETWPESVYSFYEQRQMKRFLEQWKDEGNAIDLSLRLHSDAWTEDFFRGEYGFKADKSGPNDMIQDLWVNKYLPGYRILEPAWQKSSFSKYVYDLFPQSLTASARCDFLYSSPAGSGFLIYKTPDDLLVEGECLVCAIGESFGLSGGDPPPYLLGAGFYDPSSTEKNPFSVQCIYRDLQNRPPEYVQVVVNEKKYSLAKVATPNMDYRTGVIYVGFVPIEKPENEHYFITSNGSRTFRIPREGTRPGPYGFPNNKRNRNTVSK